MVSTLEEGDRVLVNKLSYKLHDVGRGDIVVFERPPGEPDNGIEDYIKRVIALPGETVEGRDGRVVVNGRYLEEPYLDEGTVTTEFPPEIVEEGKVWVMGDNREVSVDSRYFHAIPHRRHRRAGLRHHLAPQPPRLPLTSGRPRRRRAGQGWTVTVPRVPSTVSRVPVRASRPCRCASMLSTAGASPVTHGDGRQRGLVLRRRRTFISTVMNASRPGPGGEELLPGVAGLRSPGSAGRPSTTWLATTRPARADAEEDDRVQASAERNGSDREANCKSEGDHGRPEMRTNGACVTPSAGREA